MISQFILEKQQELLESIKENIFPLVFLEVTWDNHTKLKVHTNTSRKEADLERLTKSYSSYYNKPFVVVNVRILNIENRNKLLRLLEKK